ncbi:MAG: hypothetical protein U0271_09675 [Polyangiaceae bacterium]
MPKSRYPLITLAALALAGCSSTNTGSQAATQTTSASSSSAHETTGSTSASASASESPPATRAPAVALDASFGDKGALSLTPPHSMGGSCVGVGDVLTTEDGSIFVLAQIPFGGDEPLEGCDSAVYKILPSGKLDMAFGKDGLARASKSYGVGVSLALAPDGGLYVLSMYVAESKTSGAPDLSVDLHFAVVGPALGTQALGEASVSIVKLDARGARDPSFGKSGEYRLFDKSFGMIPSAVFVDSGGGALVLSTLVEPKITDEGEVVFDKGKALLTKITAQGGTDKTFGKKGSLTYETPGSPIHGYVGRGPDGSYVFSTGKATEKLTRLTSKLELDSSYGDKGSAANPCYGLEASSLVGLSSGAVSCVSLDATGENMQVALLSVDGKSTTNQSWAWTPGALWNTVATPSGGLLVAESAGTDNDRIWHVRADGKIDSKLSGAALASKPSALLLGRSVLDASKRFVAVRTGDDGVLVVTRNAPVL